MRKSKRLQPVIKIARGDEEAAARELGEYRKVVDQHEAKLIELRHYHEEYLLRLSEAGRNGMNIAQINDYRGFISRLAVAIKQQETLVEECQQQLDEKNQVWIERRGRHQALDKVADGYLQQEYQQNEKREQAESDERSQRMGGEKRPK